MKNKKFVVVKFAILQILLLASIFTYAQADWERRQDKANQDKRDNFQRQVDLDKRHPNNGSNVGSVVSDNYSWGDNRSVKRQEAGEAKQKAILAAFDTKIDQMEKCIKQKNLSKKKENYDAIMQCATDAGLEYYTACRMFGFNATEYQTRLDRKANEKKEEDRQNEYDAQKVRELQNEKQRLNEYDAKRAQELQNEKQRQIDAETVLFKKEYEERRQKKLEVGKIKAAERAGEFPKGVTPLYIMDSNGDEFFVWEQLDKKRYVLYKFKSGDIYEASMPDFDKRIGKITKENADIYIGGINEDIKFEGEGELTFGNKSGVYTGTFKNGDFNGMGRIQRANGFYLIGNFIGNNEVLDCKYYNDQNRSITLNEFLGIPKSGFAKVDYNDCTYEGNWKNSKQNGAGTKVWSKINRYVGEFDDNKMSGTGTYYQTDGAIYNGSFKDDKYNGQGTMKYTDDKIYTGNWKDDIRNGKGVLTRKDGYNIKGSFKDNIYSNEKYYNDKNDEITLDEYKGIPKSGHGKIKFDGDSYEGNLENWKPNGKGIYTFTNGNIYEGDFVNGMFEGKGTKKWKSGVSYTGDFKKDKMEGKGIYKFVNGTIYDGDFIDNQFDGQGIKKFVNGVSYEGQFKKDEFNGKGIYKWESGNTYKGEFKNDMFNGKGTVTKLNGYYKKGDYKDDESSNLKYYSPSGKEISEDEYDKS